MYIRQTARQSLRTKDEEKADSGLTHLRTGSTLCQLVLCIKRISRAYTFARYT